MSIPVFSLEGRGFLPTITPFCESSGLWITTPTGLFYTVKGEPGHLSSQLTLSSFETLDTFTWEFGLGDLNSSSYDNV